MTVISVDIGPERSLLNRYQAQQAHTDGFYIDVPVAVTLADYIAVFYTTPLFKLERLVLATLVAKPSSDAQALALSRDEVRKFAAWTVEDRTDDQILLRDFMAKTTSWLMCEPIETGTRLWFGSAVMPERIHSNGAVYLGIGFHLLMPFHRLYSAALLQAAAQRLAR